METLERITQFEFLRAELDYLIRKMMTPGTEADSHEVKVSIATLQNELHLLGLVFDPAGETCGRITTHNGAYYRWPYLEEASKAVASDDE